jgi:serine/threonine-protein kinase
MPLSVGDAGRYQLHGEIARGGIGVVLKGRDVDLGRDVAVKVLLERHRDRPELVRRFVEEAQIAGQLQHPGVVPVHELGAFADRRPYFAMKLVKGQTLAALLAGRSSPADGLPRFLGIFEQVAQTVAYAHAAA